MQDIYDVIVIGGGVCGCACVFELASLGYSCLLLEKNESLVGEASSGNSGMLHTGFDVLDDSIELDCIRRCQGRIFPILDQLGVPVNKIGATMVAWNDQQLQRFPHVIAKSNRAGCSSIRQLSTSELQQREPHLQTSARGALLIEDEAVTDPWLLPILLANCAMKKGSEILLGAKVLSVSKDRGWNVETSKGTCSGQCVVNCAGLYGDVVDKLAGKGMFTILPRKGQYTMYTRSARSLINSSIVPVPSDVGKGVIVFRSVYDNVVVGPTAENVTQRHRAPIDDVITQRLYNVAMETVNNLTSHPVVKMYTGVRPATETKDYTITADRERSWVTVGGIRSTGLSGCLGIAERVRDLLSRDLGIETTNGQSQHVSRPSLAFTRHGTAMIDGIEHKITHPITLYGMRELMAAKM